MNLKIYDNKIAAPVKHGTRFLDKIFDIWTDTHAKTIYNDYMHESFVNKEIWFIYRDPMEHLVSALQTEIINNGVSDLTISDVISNFIRIEGTSHWDRDILKELYYVWNRVYDKGFNVVELKELSNLLIELGYNVPEFDYQEFQFQHLHNWISKEDVVLLVKTNFPKEWEYLMSIVESENQFYYKLINKIITPIEYPIIKKPTIKLI